MNNNYELIDRAGLWRLFGDLFTLLRVILNATINQDVDFWETGKKCRALA